MSLLSSIHIEYFEKLTFLMQQNLQENGVTEHLYPLPGSEEKFEIEDPYELIYEGQDMDLEPYYRLSIYDEEEPFGLMYETTPAYLREIRYCIYFFNLNLHGVTINISGLDLECLHPR